MFEGALLAWVWFGVTVCAGGCAWRAWRYARAPVHLRWDLYPVAHDPRRGHGGSHLEEKGWWTKPRRTSMRGEIVVIAEEVLLLKGVLRHNRSVWRGSLPFHWGLYLLAGTTILLVVSALSPRLAASLWWSVATMGVLGGVLLALGSVILALLRATDSRLRPYTDVADLANLALLAVLGVLSTSVAIQPDGMPNVIAAIADLARWRAPHVSPLLATHMTLAALFLAYLPATRMVHVFAKYFTYHSVRWDDRPRQAGSAMDRRLAAALEFGVSWSAPHVRTGRTWAEVATHLPADCK